MATPFFSPQNGNAIGLFQLIGPSLLRIGGNTVDKTTWTPNGPGRTTGQVAPSDIDALAGFLKAAGWQVLYGINFAQSTPALAAAEVAYAVQALGSSLYGIEIGNEVDLYIFNYFPSGFSFPNYLARWQSFVAAIRQQSPNVPLTGPDTASNVSGFVAPFAQAEGKNVILLTDHYYRANGLASNITIPFMVSPDIDIPPVAKAMQAVSQSADVPYRIAETNNFYNGGAPNVSNTYGSALSVVDSLFAWASNGAQGINLHGGGNFYYTPIADSNGVVVEARPEFYGAKFFTLAGQGAVLKTTINTYLDASAFAIRAANGTWNIVINNKDEVHNLQVTIQLPQPASSAQLIQLTGPSLSATTGTTIQGSAIQPNGAFAPGPATPVTVSGSTVSCYVSPISAALIQIAPTAPPLTVAPGLVAPASITSAYGSNLASSVSVTDSAGVSRNATVYYASPSQINFEIPDGASVGAALVTIGSQTAPLQVTAVAPSLYTLNTSGLAAAYVTRVTSGGVQQFESIFTAQNGAYLATPINLSTPPGQVYLSLFGTGIRGAGSGVTVTVGGTAVPVVYSGPQVEIAGLDQVNVLLPASLAGRGTVNIVVTANQQTANVVNIEIKQGPRKTICSSSV